MAGIMAVERFCGELVGIQMLIQKAKIRRITRGFSFTIVFKTSVHKVHIIPPSIQNGVDILSISKSIYSWHYKSI